MPILDLDYKNYVKVGFGYKAYYDRNSGKYVLSSIGYSNYQLSKGIKDDKEAAKLANRRAKEAEREKKRQEKEDERQKKLEDYQKTEEYKEKEKKRQQKEEDKAKKQEKKENKRKEKEAEKEEKRKRTWNGWYCDKHHEYVKTAVNQYYIKYYDTINETKWLEGRGNIIPQYEERKLKKGEEKEEGTDKEYIEKEENGAVQIYVKSPKSVEYEQYENDFKVTYSKQKYGQQESSDNWDNCWHRTIWDYILEHPNGPGTGIEGENDPMYKKSTVEQAGVGQEVASVQVNTNSDFLNGKENNIYRSEAEIEMERSYKQAMTDASEDWENSNQTKRTQSTTVRIWTYDENTLSIKEGNMNISGLTDTGLDITTNKTLYNEGATVQENLSGMTTSLTNSLNMIDQIITPKLVTYIGNYMATTVMTYTQKAMVDMMSFDPSEIVSLATQLMPNYITTPGQMMQMLLNNNDSISDNEIKKAEEEMMNKFNDKLAAGTAGIAKFANKQLEKCNNEIGMLSYYMQLGPAWVDQKIDKIVSSSLDTTLKYIGTTRDSVIKERNKFIKNVADNMARKLARQTNKKLETMTKQKIDELNTKKTEALAKADTMIQKAKLIIFGLLGV